MDSTQRFGNRVENYVKYRPDYPKEIITYLKDQKALFSDSIIADVGSGTGILSKIFLENGNQVYAIEPNAPMRMSAEMSFSGNNNFISLDGRAEGTYLPQGSVDLIVAGQAFHWFNPETTKVEFKRILKEEGFVVLIWNERLVKTSFEKSYEKILTKYSTDYLKVDHRNISMEKIESFFSPNPVKYMSFSNEQVFDFVGLKGRLLSSSYAPNEDSADFHTLLEELEESFKTHEREGKVRFGYESKVFWGKLH